MTLWKGKLIHQNWLSLQTMVLTFLVTLDIVAWFLQICMALLSQASQRPSLEDLIAELEQPVWTLPPLPTGKGITTVSHNRLLFSNSSFVIHMLLLLSIVQENFMWAKYILENFSFLKKRAPFLWSSKQRKEHYPEAAKFLQILTPFLLWKIMHLIQLGT